MSAATAAAAVIIAPKIGEVTTQCSSMSSCISIKIISLVIIISALCLTAFSLRIIDKFYNSLGKKKMKKTKTKIKSEWNMREDIFLWTMYLAFFWTGYASGTRNDWEFPLTFLIIIVPLSIYLRNKNRKEKKK